MNVYLIDAAILLAIFVGAACASAAAARRSAGKRAQRYVRESLRNLREGLRRIARLECGAHILRVDALAEDEFPAADFGERPDDKAGVFHALRCRPGCLKFGACPASKQLFGGNGRKLDARALGVLRCKACSFDADGRSVFGVLDDYPEKDTPPIDVVYYSRDGHRWTPFLLDLPCKIGEGSHVPDEPGCGTHGGDNHVHGLNHTTPTPKEATAK